MLNVNCNLKKSWCHKTAVVIIKVPIFTYKRAYEIMAVMGINALIR